MAMAVAAGDIAFVAFSADNAGEGFAFVALNPIAAGDSIRFIEGAGVTDTGAAAPGATSADASMLWTNGNTTLPAGTVVQINFGANSTAAAPNPAATTSPIASIGTASAVTNHSGATNGWALGIVANGASSDNLYAVTGQVGAPGTYVAAVVYGNATTPAMTTGASVARFTGATATDDVYSISRSTSDASYANAGAARTAYTSAGTSATTTGNWVRDAGINDATSGNNNPEWTALGDANSPLYNKTSLRVETTAPTVTGVAYGPNDGALAANEPVTFRVTFSEIVLVTGAPTLTLNATGTSTGAATYTSGSGGNVLTFTYTPAAGQNTADLAVTAFNLNGGTVRDGAGNNANTAGAVANPTPTLAVDTAPDSNVVVDLTDASTTATTASVALNVSGLDAGSTATVTFAGSGPTGGSTTATYTANGAQTANVSGLRGDITATVSVRDAAGNVAAGQGETLANDPVCFMAGTMVRTPSGEVPVETLKAGAPVLTAGGEAAPVRWLGRQTVSTRFADPLRVLPVRIAAGALGESLPVRDLLVSPDHALLVGGVLVHAGALVNGTTIRRETNVPEVFTYWHVELADHALVLAEGVPAETFIDNVDRLAFDNWAEHEAAGPVAPIAEMALPRAKSARQVPPATRRRLAERAALLLGKAAAA